MNSYVHTKNYNYPENTYAGQRNVFPAAQKRIYQNFEADRRIPRKYRLNERTSTHTNIDAIITVFRGSLVSDSTQNIEWNASSLF